MRLGENWRADSAGRESRLGLPVQAQLKTIYLSSGSRWFGQASRCRASAAGIKPRIGEGKRRKDQKGNKHDATSDVGMLLVLYQPCWPMEKPGRRGTGAEVGRVQWDALSQRHKSNKFP